MTEPIGDDDAIRTPDQRLRVFVSSTLSELAEERAVVSRAISSLRLAPVMFEQGARSHPPQELYRAYLAQSDIFIGLYWQRYGWIGPGMDISGLEDEFRRSAAMPRLMYLKAPAPEREPELAAMIAELQSEATASYRTFRTSRELGRLVRDDLAVLLGERFTTSHRAAPSTASSEAARSSALPTASTSLFGREPDITAVVDLLQAPGTRLVTLTGAGGIGKTRLAIAIGTRLEDKTGRRTVFVPLASVDQAELVLPRIAAATGALLEGTRRPVDALVDHFAEHPTLLVLDNLEQVVGVAPELDELLNAAPDLTILATSRSALRLRAEREYRVEGLLVPSLMQQPLIDVLMSLPAVQLFVDRAKAVRYDFALTAENALAVVEICRRLDGLPLAIELAAARVRLLDPTALLARLEHLLDALGTGPVDLPERQRTLRATVEWSVGLLDDSEREMLASLAVFVDGWTIDAAVQVSGETDDRTLDLLDALARHSLVVVVATATEPRFRMLGTVRELAAEHLAARGARAATEERHARYYESLVGSATWPDQGQTDWAGKLAVDEENLRAAIRWFFDHDRAPLPHIFRTLWFYWQLGDRMPEGRSWTQRLRADDEAFDDHARAELLFTSAVTAVEVGDDDSALAALEGFRRLGGNLEDPYLLTAFELAAAWILPIVNDHAGALTAASNALAGFRQQDDPFVAFAALTVGIFELGFGHDDAARAAFTEVDELGARFGNQWLETAARTHLSLLASRANQLDTAETLLLRSIGTNAEAQLGTLSMTFTLVAFAQLALAKGDANCAAKALGAVEGLRMRSGLRAWPSTRTIEADLVDAVRLAADPEAYAESFAAGAELHARDALAFVREGLS